MPLIGGLLGTLFGQLFTLLAKWFGAKLANAVAWVATFGVLTVGLIVAASALGSALLTAWPGIAGFETGIWTVSADVGVGAGMTCIAVDLLCYVYRWNVNNLAFLSKG